MHPDKRQVLPLAPEFVRNSDGKGGKYHKQDCEINAGCRMLERLRSDYPRMAAIIVADSLYSKQPFVERLRAARFSFLLVAKPGDHKSLYQDVAVLRRGNLLERHITEHRQERREYEWVTGLPLNGKPDAPLINFIQFRIIKADGGSYRNAWVTDLVPTSANIVQLVRAARARWKIENEGFNTLKNQGYHLEHNFGHGDQYLSEAFFTLNLLAFFMHQIFELVDGLYQRVRTFFSSRRAFWDEVRSAFRLFLFTSWDQVVGAHELAATAAAPVSGSIVVSHLVSMRATAAASRPDNHATQLSPGLGMRPAVPAVARATDPYPGSRSLRRLVRPAECPRHHLRVSPLPNILSRPSTTVHRESLRARPCSGATEALLPR